MQTNISNNLQTNIEEVRPAQERYTSENRSKGLQSVEAYLEPNRTSMMELFCKNS